MAIILNGTTGITTPDITSAGSLNIDASAPDNSLVVDSAGNLGLGVTPSAWNTFNASFQIAGASLSGLGENNTALASNAYYNSGWKYYGTASASSYQQNAGQHAWSVAPSGTAGNAISFTQAMTLDASGNLLMGTASYAAGQNAIMLRGSSSNFSRNSTAASAQIYFENPNGTVGQISTSGSSTSFLTSSDYRLKEDWQPMTGASERVKALKPINFAWKVDGSRVDGFLAHEAQEVVPECVSGVKDAMRTEAYEVTPAVLDDDGNITTEAVMGEREVPEYQGIDQSKLVPLLTAALQEALTKIDALTARIEALEETNE